MTAGVDFEVLEETSTPRGRRVLYVASDNPMNRHGLRDFLRHAWPAVREAVPDAELTVVGAVGASVPVAPPGVTVMGRVDDLAPLYRDCRVVINPAVAGHRRQDQDARGVVPPSPGRGMAQRCGRPQHGGRGALPDGR